MAQATPAGSVHPALSSRTCYHRYAVAPGLFTPGAYLEIDPKLCLDELGLPADLTGLRVLDIGAFDGPYTFEMERRGATVVGLDIQDPDITVFNAVKGLLGSKAEFVRGSVYDATPEKLGTFDVVLYAGVYYHLKNPVLAFQRLRRVLKDGGRLFLEGAAGSDYLGEHVAARLGLPKSRAPDVTQVLDALPISYFDTEQKIYPHWSNWWFPTTGCIEAMLRDSGFKDVQLHLRKNAMYQYTHRRLFGSATADPAKPDPEAMRHENGVLEKDPEVKELLIEAGGARKPGLARRLARRLRALVS